MRKQRPNYTTTKWLSQTLNPSCLILEAAFQNKVESSWLQPFRTHATWLCVSFLAFATGLCSGTGRVGRFPREAWVPTSEGHMTRDSACSSQNLGQVHHEWRGPPTPPVPPPQLDGFWDALPCRDKLLPQDTSMSPLGVGGSERHMPLIPCLLCTDPGLPILGNLPPRQRSYHGSTQPNRENRRQPRLSEQEVSLDESSEQARAWPGHWCPTAVLLPLGHGSWL